MIKATVETVPAPYTKETFCVYFTVCDMDSEGAWVNEIELFDRQKTFDTFTEAFRYINRWFSRAAQALMDKYNRSCLQINIDRDLWINEHINDTEPCQAGVYWVNGLYNLYCNR